MNIERFIILAHAAYLGAIHADDASYLLTYKIWLEDANGEIKYKQKESKVVRNMVSFVTKFVQTGFVYSNSY